MTLASTRIPLLVTFVLLGGLSLSAEQVETAASASPEATENLDAVEPSQLPLEEPSKTFLSSYCGASLSCDGGGGVSCSCPAPNGGTCNDYPNGNPWGGYVRCQCSGSPFVQEYHCNYSGSCTQRSCDTQCGGPGSGVCSGGTCYCY